MLVYEKKVEGVRHLFGTEGTIPGADDVQLTYKDADGEALELSLQDKYVDDKKGGIIRKSDGAAVNVFIGGHQIIGEEVVPPEPPTVVGIEVTAPTKVEYVAGETLDLTGMVVKKKMSDETEETIVTGYTVTPAEGTILTVEDDKITVSLDDTQFAEEIAITVEAATITRTVDMNGGTAGGESICVDEVLKGLDWVPDLWYSQNHSTWTIPEGKAWNGVTTVKDDESTKISHMVLDSDCTFYVLWKDA